MLNIQMPRKIFTSFLLACVSHALMMGMKRYRPTSMYTYHRGVVS